MKAGALSATHTNLGSNKIIPDSLTLKRQCWGVCLSQGFGWHRDSWDGGWMLPEHLGLPGRLRKLAGNCSILLDGARALGSRTSAFPDVKVKQWKQNWFGDSAGCCEIGSGVEKNHGNRAEPGDFGWG